MSYRVVFCGKISNFSIFLDNSLFFLPCDFLPISPTTIYILIFCHDKEGGEQGDLTFGGVLSSNACNFSGSGGVEGRLWEYLGFKQVVVFQLFVKGGLGFVRKIGDLSK